MVGRLAAALAGLILIGCGPLWPTPTPTAPAHATGARDVVLRMSVAGGLPNPGLTIEQPPDFSLYGDGKVIRILAQTSPDGSYTTELRQGQLTAQEVDELLRTALNEGGLTTAAERYDNDQIFDAATTKFVIDAGGVRKTVYVYALGFLDELTANAHERAGFRLLRDRINAAAGAATDLGTYVPEAYRVTLAEPYSSQAANAQWLWPDLVPADFQLLDNGFRTRLMTPEESTAVLGLGITHDLVTRAPDEHLYLVRIRGLLPDEIPLP
jgi:hypothetical protein